MDVRVGLIKKFEHWVINAFEPWCWRRLLRVPWTARRSNQLILKKISPEYSLEGRMLKLKLQYFRHLMRRTNSFEETLMLGKIKSRRRRGQQRIRWFEGITDSMDMSFSKLCNARGHRESDMTERLNWLIYIYNFIYLFIGCAMLNLHCFSRAFSGCSAWGLLFFATVQASYCGGFSNCKAQTLGMRASFAAAHRLSTCGSWALK